MTTLADLRQIADSMSLQVERFRALSPAQRRRLPPELESAFDAWDLTSEALRLFVASEPPPDHPSVQDPAFAAMRGSVSLLRRALDKVAPTPKDRN